MTDTDGTQLGRKRIPTIEIPEPEPERTPETQAEQITDTIVVLVMTNAQVALLAASQMTARGGSPRAALDRANVMLRWLNARDEETAE